VSLEPRAVSLADINIARHNRSIVEDEVKNMRKQLLFTRQQLSSTRKKKMKIKSVAEFIKGKVDESPPVPWQYQYNPEESHSV